MSINVSEDVQLVFSNAMEFNSEESQIHEDAQTLKVCSPQAAVHLPPEGRTDCRSPASISLYPISLHHTLFLSVQLRPGPPRSRRGFPVWYRDRFNLYDECYGIYPCEGRVRNAQGSGLARLYQCSCHDKSNRAKNSNFGPKQGHSVEGSEGRGRGS